MRPDPTSPDASNPTSDAATDDAATDDARTHAYDVDRPSRRRLHYEGETYEDTFVVSGLVAIAVVYVAVGGTSRVSAREISALVVRVMAAQASYCVGEVTSLVLYVVSFVLLYVVAEASEPDTISTWLNWSAALVASALLLYSLLATTMYVLFDRSYFVRLEYTVPILWCAFAGLETTLAVVSLAGYSAYDGSLMRTSEGEAVDVVSSHFVGVVVATLLKQRRFEMHGFSRAASTFFFSVAPALVGTLFLLTHRSGSNVTAMSTLESMLVALGLSVAAVAALALLSTL